MGTQPEYGASEPQRPGRLSAGDRLGRFEILGPLGAGGMGDVYRARDPQLRRDVAIKVLSTAFSRDPAREHRFEREALAAARLNHPNIIAVHDFGVQDGIEYIVTELLDGQTLRQTIDGRPLAPATAVEYAIEIASGLAAGHDQGIVHLDIKPDNVFVTREGRIKILDFGLARMTGGNSPDHDSATLTLDGVEPTSVAGTAAYMSPEQGRGLRTDHRSDIFSTGAVLFEMLAGFAPFRRANSGETLSAVLEDDPPPLKRVAPELERVVQHCLEKSPEKRFQSARDLVFNLRALPPAALTRVSASRGLRPRLWAVALLAGLIAAPIVYLATQRPTPPAPPSVFRVERLTDSIGIEEFPSISPDGRSVAFSASVHGRRQLFVRLLAGGLPVQVTSDGVDHELPRWAPDGNSLVYFSPAGPGESEGHIWRISALGGSPRRVIDSIGGADVGRGGRVAFFRLVSGEVQLVTSTLEGTDIRVIAESVPGYHLYPRWSPDGDWIAFQRGDGLRFDIFIVRHNGGAPRQLTRDRNIIKGLAWLPDSQGIVYGSSRGSTIPYLPPLSLWQVSLNGDARQISPPDAWYEQPDVHHSGLVSASRVRMRFDIWKFPFEHAPAENVRLASQVTRQTGQVLTPTAAPDGNRIAFLSDSGGHGNLWVMSMETGQLRQITFEDDPTVTVGVPVWSPDGRSIAFVSSKGRTGYDFGVWVVDPDGSKLRNVVKQGLGIAWSADSNSLYYAETSAGVVNRIPVSGGTPVRVRQESVRNIIGPHGTTLYYTVARPLLDGRPEFEIRAATPDTGASRALARVTSSRVPSWQIVNPALSPDGEWLAMPLTDGLTTNVWALSTRTGQWRQVTDFGERAIFIARRVSWSADGRSVLAAVGEGDADIVLLDGLIARAGTPPS
jgi:eukaryotic-like serine/threonine-protein kinase